MIEEKQRLDEYAATSRTFADAVERLRNLTSGVEPFIRALAETGAAHRACEQARIRLDKHLAQLSAPDRVRSA